ncbi:helix-turn-helix domain-containing protein [Thalassotalea sp. ND16A]|uniref:helix-turn-helix domain-containing protein n=1 Tax=Thalassotalea sp. ND16A TaxID=1535422 RepID=UPI00051A46FA|nr:helix-turn-helix domain-containing protein [Thalassotalea sp. ND16A]KGJ97962.1 putative transcriptional regulator, XRE family [Thalassotalea sp. ND16A]
MTFGKQLKKLRSERNLSQPQLAELVGIEQSYLSKLENDKSVPSNEIFRQILQALNIKIADFLKSINSASDKQNLVQIPDVELWYMQQDNKNFKHQRRYLYFCSALIVLAVTLFYTGFSKLVFSEVRYQYYSAGVILEGEPKNIFHEWSRMIDAPIGQMADLRRTKEVEMTNRKDEVEIDMPMYLGKSYMQTVEGGQRHFSERGTINIPRAINSWLQVLGVLLFACGVMGFVLERKLFSTER